MCRHGGVADNCRACLLDRVHKLQRGNAALKASMDRIAATDAGKLQQQVDELLLKVRTLEFAVSTTKSYVGFAMRRSDGEAGRVLQKIYDQL